MKIALAQINSTLGDFEANAQLIIEKVLEANENGSDLIIFSELALFGYMPADLLERPELIRKQIKVLKKMIKSFPEEIAVLFGAVMPHEKMKRRFYNSAVFAYKRKIQKIFFKELLPNYDVFDERRFFVPGDLKQGVIQFKKKRMLVTICEDLWFEESQNYLVNPLDSLKGSFDYVFNLSASPFTKNKLAQRQKILKKVSQKFSATSIYVNQVGAQDELIFDGNSFVLDSKGKKSLQLKSFQEDIQYTDSKNKIKKQDQYEAIFQALVLGIKDYFAKSGFEKTVLGLSGGIDSGLVLALASEALGSENVTGVFMPGPYSSKLSDRLARKISKNLKTSLEVLDVNSVYHQFIKSFDAVFGKTSFGLMHENLQARLRALALMAFSNRENALLLATSNKSELCVGYSTLYGDQCGALMPIGDLLKTEVFELCYWYNDFKGEEMIPLKMIERPPSAELRPNQKDQDSLPSYDVLDPLVEKLITKRSAVSNKDEEWVLQKSYRSEFKRWQAPPILKISEHSFGRGRRMPLAHSANCSL